MNRSTRCRSPRVAPRRVSQVRTVVRVGAVGVMQVPSVASVLLQLEGDGVAGQQSVKERLPDFLI